MCVFLIDNFFEISYISDIAGSVNIQRDIRVSLVSCNYAADDPFHFFLLFQPGNSYQRIWAPRRSGITQHFQCTGRDDLYGRNEIPILLQCF